ncbi:hypothetical protein CEXT_7921 [Caerostris extrusa]|uniref:Uncharacterized protein n=1 Tax=Caerostris extrusa TaxID=172846 RepID=A0AAV4PTM2_CAEEX|nr:hypothetical protein CEXT_7921 [Caerostris extrusa]
MVTQLVYIGIVPVKVLCLLEGFLEVKRKKSYPHQVIQEILKNRSNSRNGGHHRWALEEILPKSQGQAVVVPLANHNILAPAAIKLDVTYWIRMRDVIALQSEGGGAMMSSPTNGSVLEESNTLRWHSVALFLLHSAKITDFECPKNSTNCILFMYAQTANF